MANRKPLHQGERRVRSRAHAEAAFPAAPPLTELPGDYLGTLEEIKQRIQKERLRIVVSANQAMVLLYWDLGRLILARQGKQGWGAKVIDRLAADLRAAFPDMQGFSPRNLLFMRSFAEAYREAEFVKQVVSLLPWGHVLRLLQREKELFRQAAENRLIAGVERWMEHHRSRNLTSHTYDPEVALEVFEDAPRLLVDAKAFLTAIEARND